jgi:hypothetical protein
LEAAASKMKISLGEFMHALSATRGEVGKLATGPTRDAIASYARQIYNATRLLEGGSQITALGETAAAAAGGGGAAGAGAAATGAGAAETGAGAGAAASGSGAAAAGSGASTVATGGRVLGFFGRIGAAIGLTGAAATAAGIAATVLTLGALTYGGARLAGDLAGDSPTAQYGDAANRPRGEPPAAPTNTAAPEERYAVWLLTNVASGSVFVGQESAINGTLTCQWGGGGLCADSGGADIPTEYTKLSADYFTLEAAHTDFCTAMTSEPKYIPIAFGTKATVYGGDYWIDFVEPCE